MSDTTEMSNNAGMPNTAAMSNPAGGPLIINNDHRKSDLPLRLISSPKNPNACTCGFYLYRRHPCGHAEKDRHVCGASFTPRGNPCFCKHPAPVHDISNVVMTTAKYSCIECAKLRRAQEAAALAAEPAQNLKDDGAQNQGVQNQVAQNQVAQNQAAQNQSAQNQGVQNQGVQNQVAQNQGAQYVAQNNNALYFALNAQYNALQTAQYNAQNAPFINAQNDHINAQIEQYNALNAQYNAQNAQNNGAQHDSPYYYYTQ